MSRPTLEVADIFRAHADNFIDKNTLGFQQLKVIRAITRCRTAALGGHVDVCPQCGGDPAISYNSCRNRHCNKCQAQARHRWIDARKQELLHTRYFHVVFTLPHELHTLVIIRLNSTTCCSARSLKLSARLHAIPNISGQRSGSSASFTRGVRIYSFTLISTASFLVVEFLLIVPCGF